MQDHLASGSSPLKLRIGLNLGDVIVGRDGDLYGDGINIAVRLEGVADPGGILVSEKVYSEIEADTAPLLERTWPALRRSPVLPDSPDLAQNRQRSPSAARRGTQAARGARRVAPTASSVTPSSAGGSCASTDANSSGVAVMASKPKWTPM